MFHKTVAHNVSAVLVLIPTFGLLVWTLGVVQAINGKIGEIPVKITFPSTT